MFRRKLWKYITFTFPIEKEYLRIYKNGEEITKGIYSTDYNLLTAQSLWQAYYQILSIIFLKEFIKLNGNKDTILKNLKLVELNKSIAAVFSNTHALIMI